MPPRTWLASVLLVCWTCQPARAQTVTHSGFVEGGIVGYPQEAPNDRTRAIAAALVRWDPALRWLAWGVDASLEARADTHDMTQATATFQDRTNRRPALTVRRLSASWAYGPVTVDLGKQFIRWGKTDIVVPTERFAPRDYLEVVQTDLLAVTAARVAVARPFDTVEVVVARLTPSRAPLFDQRWVTVPAQAAGLPIVDAGADFPGRAQIGARWNHLGRSVEFSVSGFRGSHHLPELLPDVRTDPPRVEVRRRYAALTSLGGDMAVPLPWVTLKAEAAWLTSSRHGTEEFVIYVLQVEKQAGEWLFIGGYAGDHVTSEGATLRFSPDRGLSRAFVGRASYTIDTNRSIVFEGVARQNGDGLSLRVEYSVARGQHTRVTAGARLIRGDEDDFLGRYRRNSSASIVWRYSF